MASLNTSIVPLSPEMMTIIDGSHTNGLVPFSREIFLLDIIVAGTSFCKKRKEIAPLLEEGYILKMIRHPKNEYDEMAIGIYADKEQLGWVPQELNEIISRLMDAGKAFFARVEKSSWKKEWLKVDAKIYMVE